MAPQPAAEVIPAELPADLGQCDAVASGAESGQVRVTRGLQVLDLCGHHFAELEWALACGGWQVTLDTRPTPSG
jgi:hypothetical protein